MVNDLVKIMYASKCFIHSTIVMVHDGRDTIWGTQVFETAEYRVMNAVRFWLS